MKMVQAMPVLRPLCRSLKYATQPRLVISEVAMSLERSEHHPGIASGSRSRDVQLFGRPLDAGIGRVDVELVLDPVGQRFRQGRAFAATHEQRVQGLRQVSTLLRDLRVSADGASVIQRDAGNAKQQQRRQAGRGADPVPGGASFGTAAFFGVRSPANAT